MGKNMALVAIAIILGLGAWIVGGGDLGVAAEPPPVQTEKATPPAAKGLNEEKATGEEAGRVAPLEPLQWMVGVWVDRGGETTITTQCSWTENRKFLKRTFRLTKDGQVTLHGTQLIGWDPIEKQIRSWTFDSEGGFGEGRWIRDGNRWMVKTSYVLADGKRASALNVITYVDQDTLRWQSIDREVDGELQPNIPEVTVVRQKTEANASQPGGKKEVQP